MRQYPKRDEESTELVRVSPAEGITPEVLTRDPHGPNCVCSDCLHGRRKYSTENRPQGHTVDEKLLDMIRESALKEQPHDGFVSSMVTNDQRPDEVEKLVIYAWGNSARVLADQLNIVPMSDKTRRIHGPVTYDRPSPPKKAPGPPDAGRGNLVPRLTNALRQLTHPRESGSTSQRTDYLAHPDRRQEDTEK